MTHRIDSARARTAQAAQTAADDGVLAIRPALANRLRQGIVDEVTLRQARELCDAYLRGALPGRSAGGWRPTRGDALNMANELANAIKAVFLHGETLTVRIIQEGREAGQGVGYLDDGTMVVVDEGRYHINAEVGVVVTKVLQTTAGRMIFARLENNK
jgi:hypothetical protein